MGLFKKTLEDVEKWRLKGKIQKLSEALGYKKDENVPREAAAAIFRMSTAECSPDDLSMMTELQSVGLEPDYNETIQKAAEILGHIGDDRSIALLISALREKEKRVAAAKALASIGPRALSRIDRQAIDALVRELADKDLKKSASKTLTILRGVAAPTLVAALKDEAINYQAVRVLQVGADEHVISLLISALHERDKRVAASDALAKIGEGALAKIDPGLIDSLVRELADKDLKKEASKVLANIGANAVAPLMEALKDEGLRNGAVKALKETKAGDDCLRRQFKKAFEGGVRPLKLGIVRAISEMPDFRFKEEILKRAHFDKDEEVRKAVPYLPSAKPPEPLYASQPSSVKAPSQGTLSAMKCMRCGRGLRIFDMSRGALTLGGQMPKLYDAVKCSSCGKWECMNCKGTPPSKPCSWCGGQVAPMFK
jgi:HEAT repeat protein